MKTRDEALAAVRARIERFERTRDPDVILDTEAAIESAALARFRVLPRGAEDLAVCRAAGHLFWYRYVELAKRRDGREDANRTSALAYLRSVYRDDPAAVPEPAEEALIADGATPPAVPRHARSRLGHVAKALETALATGDRTTSERSLRTLREAAREPHVNDAAEAPTWFILGLALLQRYNERELPADLDDAISLFARCGADELVRRKAAPNLGYARYLRFEHSGQRADLEEAIPLLRAGLLGLPPGHPYFDMRHDSMAVALDRRYRLTSEVADLNEAISALRLAAEFNYDPRTLPGTLARLSLLSRMRYAATGDGDSLKEAVASGRRAVKAVGAGASPLPALAALGGALFVRFQNDGDLADLDEAISVFRRVLDRVPAGGGYRADALASVAAALIERARRAAGYSDRARGDLDEAVALLRQAPTTGLDPEQRANTQRLLGAALLDRLEQSGDAALPDQAVELTSQAVDAAEGTSHHARALIEHGTALHMRYRATDDPTDLRAAVAAARSAATAHAATPALRVEAAGAWGQWAADAGMWPEATAGFQHLVRWLSHLAPAYLRRSDQERRLAWTFMHTSDAAAAALHAGRTETAVELLEQGRVILNSAALDQDDQLAEVGAAMPALASELRAAGAASGGIEAELRAVRLPDADRRFRLAERWDQLVAQVRAVPGFERFLMPPRLSDLLPAAAEGPIAVINVSRYRCDALLLHRAEARLVPLPDLTSDELTVRVRAFGEALRVAGRADAGLIDRMTAQDTARKTLEWLWDTVADPVLAALGLTGPPASGQPWPRIWWSPTGPLSFLPLHAAGHHADGGPTVLDRVVSSYTPTVRALLHARRRAETVRPAPVLMVAMPRTPGHADLRAAHTEGTRIAAARPGSRVLAGAQATRANVLQALPQYSWAHFACHAHSDPAAPSTSHLLLHDQPLTVNDIARLGLGGVALAYLSACSTARTSTALSGEAIHLGSGFQLAGFPHVIATLWPVGDESAARIAEEFYRLLRPHERPAPAAIAGALHAVIRQERDRYPRTPTVWAAHVHTGP